MPPTQDQVQAVFSLAQQYEDVAQNIFEFAQQQLENDPTTFNQVYKNYLTIMQKAQDMYYSVSHAETTVVASGDDIKAIASATKKLKDSLSALNAAQKAITVSLKALAVVGTVTAAIVDPTHVSAGAAVSAISDFVTSLAGGGGGGA
jgi:hypothetical protein